MNIKTPLGQIEVIVASDKHYPGLFTSVNGTELVLVEFDVLQNKHVIRVWDHKNPDGDPVYIQIID